MYVNLAVVYNLVLDPQAQPDATQQNETHMGLIAI